MSTMTEKEIKELQIAIELDEVKKSKRLLLIQLQRKLDELSKRKQAKREEDRKRYKKTNPALAGYCSGNKRR